MANRSKQKGTAWETAAVRYLQEHGLYAKRNPLAGAADVGDIDIGAAVVLECKAEKSYSLSQYMTEVDREVVNAGARFGFAWLKRVGKTSPADGYVVTTGRLFVPVLEALIREEK